MSEKRFLVAPSILSADFSKLADEVAAVTQGGADWIHVDVMDGHFVPNLTIGAPVVKSLRPVCKITLDCHLMIENPEKYVEDFAKAGADYITIHVESTERVGETLKKIRALGVKPGITLRPATPVTDIFPFLSLVDLVLVMTVNPGFGGQKFMLDQVVKISQIRQELKRINHQALIQVDGGVAPDTIAHLKEADVLVAGSAVFGQKDYSSAIANLRKAK